MDWKYKHFKQSAIFNAPVQSVLEAARATVAESLGPIEDTAEGFTARGNKGWQAVIATFRIMYALEGTQVTAELLVERSTLRGYMLFDVGNYYNGLIDKWFSGITQRLGGVQEQILVSKTTSYLRAQRGCLAAVLVYLMVGACLGIIATPLDRALFPQPHGSTLGPLSIASAVIGLFAGIAAYLFIRYPDSTASKFIKERVRRNQK